MKKIVIILIALVAMQVTAQEKKRDHQRDGQRAQMEAMKDLSPEEIATLQTKKMTLHLDLNESQQKKVESLFLEEAKLRKAKMEERKAMKESGEKKQFTPQRGATGAMLSIGYDDINLERCLSISYGQPIDANPAILITGCYKTSEGRYGKFHVTDWDLAGNLTIEWVTWDYR